MVGVCSFVVSLVLFCRNNWTKSTGIGLLSLLEKQQENVCYIAVVRLSTPNQSLVDDCKFCKRGQVRDQLLILVQARVNGAVSQEDRQPARHHVSYLYVHDQTRAFDTLQQMGFNTWTIHAPLLSPTSSCATVFLLGESKTLGNSCVFDMLKTEQIVQTLQIWLEVQLQRSEQQR